MKILFFFASLALSLNFAVAAISPDHLIAGFGGSRTQPIKITAEELTIDQRARQALFSGSAQAQQGKMSITALRMSVNYEVGAKGQVEPKFLYASGDVKLIGSTKAKKGAQPPRVHARLAEYNIETKKLILVGAVELYQDGQVLRGQSLTIDMVSGLSRLDSSQEGKAGRIRGVFRKKSR